MIRYVFILILFVLLMPGCSLFGSNDGGGSSGSGGEKETTSVDHVELRKVV